MASNSGAAASPTSQTAEEESDDAVKFVCNKCFHRRLMLPATASHGPLRITYSTTTNFEDTSLPTVLYIGPMFGTRWHALEVSHIAEQEGVRIILSDRPGMGGSTPVPLSQRVHVWLETAPALLEALNVKHVSLLTHSAGTIYTLNTLYHLRHILDPQRPFVAFMAPWVHNSHSDAMLMNLASKVPTSIMSGWSSVAGFINQRVMPVTSWSGGVLSDIANVFSTESADPEATAMRKFGRNRAFAEQVGKLQMMYINAESIAGGSEEAKLCLKKGEAGLWGVCEDYEDYVRLLVTAEKTRHEQASQPKLKVQAFFSESDVMIGKKGQQYFEDCWKGQNLEDLITFESTTMPGTNHDSVLIDLEKGALQKVLQEVKGSG